MDLFLFSYGEILPSKGSGIRASDGSPDESGSYPDNGDAFVEARFNGRWNVYDRCRG
ncbi:MAG: hypothetical protein IAE88_00845 [Rhodobacteraceae bacterium]|nr:hypothetical protein [Paracoccaceae bacterium]